MTGFPIAENVFIILLLIPKKKKKTESSLRGISQLNWLYVMHRALSTWLYQLYIYHYYLSHDRRTQYTYYDLHSLAFFRSGSSIASRLPSFIWKTPKKNACYAGYTYYYPKASVVRTQGSSDSHDIPVTLSSKRMSKMKTKRLKARADPDLQIRGWVEGHPDPGWDKGGGLKKRFCLV